jgi:hypothetical protein
VAGEALGEPLSLKRQIRRWLLPEQKDLAVPLRLKVAPVRPKRALSRIKRERRATHGR